jgi:hypothetical protein
MSRGRIPLTPTTLLRRQGQIWDLDFLAFEDGTDMMSRNVGKGLPLDAS